MNGSGILAVLPLEESVAALAVSVSGDSMVAGSVVAGSVAAGSVTAGSVAAGSVAVVVAAVVVVMTGRVAKQALTSVAVVLSLAQHAAKIALKKKKRMMYIRHWK